MITAFSARITSSIGAPSAGTTLVFGTETLDLGDGYDPSTGIYTVQQNGTYTFTWSITIYNNGYFTTALMINSSPKQYLRSTNASGTITISSTSTVVTEVNVGDKVYIEITYKSGNPVIQSIFVHSGYSSTFGGGMLQ